MKNKYVYVKNMVSMDLAEYMCTWHLKNYKKTFVSTQVQDAFCEPVPEDSAGKMGIASRNTLTERLVK